MEPTAARPGAVPRLPGRGDGIDRKIDPRPARRFRLLAVTGASLALGTLLVTALVLALDRQQVRVDRSTVSIARVERTTFQESISAVGTLVPRTTVYLDLVESGRIEEVLVHEGALVHEDQPLLRLSNNDLQLRLIALGTQQSEQLNRLRDMRFSLRQSDLELQQRLAEMDFQILQLQRKTARNLKLFESQLISQQEKEQVEAELEYLRAKRDLVLEDSRQYADHQKERIRQMEAEAERIEASASLIQEIQEGLVLKAPIAGQLTALAAEVGELRPVGSRLGQIDRLSDGFRVRASVDEYYLNRLAQGQQALTLPIDSEEHALVVRRVYPEVRDGKFTVDLEFEGSEPDGLTRGQTVGFQLRFGSPQETLVVPRGPFYQATGGNWVYVLDGGDRLARRREIKPGRLSDRYLEVLEGLEEGDRVIVSSYDSLNEGGDVALD